ncbi:MAG: A/G-specific adenine glycosylase [Phycisphaerales bacterium]|nr:A/G-specific adenine glycosylase [Phycisphaerales bacterium]
MSSARSGKRKAPRPATARSAADRRRDAAIAKGVAEWFTEHARELPWRDLPPGRRDPYRVLVSELMLQQTQASRVAERYPVFIGRFPTPEALAGADEEDVLALWSGLGYYRRAKHLHAAAKTIEERFGGRMPRDPKELRSIPGVGTYTAGAIASLAFDLPEPAVDGNVTRVFLRLLGERLSLNTPAAQRLAGEAARAVLTSSSKAGVGPGLINEGLIELGATICTPRSPSCERCPLAGLCIAKREGLTDTIPAPKKAAPKKTIHALAVLAIDAAGARLVERRGDTGLWAGLWQAPTVESPEPIDPATARPGGVAPGELLDAFVHETTHRTIRFIVCAPAPGKIEPGPGAVWKPTDEIERLGLSSAQRRILLNAPLKPRPDNPKPPPVNKRPPRYAVPAP